MYKNGFNIKQPTMVDMPWNQTNRNLINGIAYSEMSQRKR